MVRSTDSSSARRNDDGNGTPRFRRSGRSPRLDSIRRGAGARLRAGAVRDSARPEAIALDIVHAPQFDGLGLSATSRRYSIKSVAEAEAYLRHPILGARLLESARAALGMQGRSALEVLEPPDDMKLRSSATLFASVSPAGSVFEQLLDKYLAGEPAGRRRFNS